MTGRVRDNDGHLWLITGWWCRACGMPLHPLHQLVGLHPSCEDQAMNPTDQSIEGKGV